MTTANQDFWAWVAPLLRQAYGVCDMTPTEIDAWLETLDEEELPDAPPAE